ncbi:MAG: hypothetical protein HPY82_00630 [Gammaproteobacteria bacterium]|nr:hypothetical protein [Gammaproteobacteria bacterium]
MKRKSEPVGARLLPGCSVNFLAFQFYDTIRVSIAISVFGVEAVKSG